jgi:cellulose synthase/poly-beta-1,6-N-acetylglucosamine synthase-like glycosyltransferase
MKKSDQRTVKPGDSDSELHLISIIIPFKDNQEEVVEIEAELRKQSYPAEKMELIFVDNASSRSFRFPDEFMNRHTILTETNYPDSPYSARNRGVEASKGDIIVFLDANSRPDHKWLEKGLQCLQSTGKRMAAGAVKFDFGDKVTAGKIADALTSIRMREAVEERQVAYTANLFVKKEVFEKVGLFEEGVRSGGDVRFCMKAVRQGFAIAYCEDAVVYKKARNTSELYKKKFRTGKGYYATWLRTDPKKRMSPIYNFLRAMKPPGLSEIKNHGLCYRIKIRKLRLVIVYFHLYSIRVIEQTGFLFVCVKQKLG